jgi:hypothetical protein
MSNDLAVILANAGEIQLASNGMQVATVAQAYAFSELMDKAGWLPKGVAKEGATIAIVAGRALGLDPFQSVQGIAPINGRPTLWGDSMVAVVKASGLVEDEQVEYVPDKRNCQGVRYTIKRKGIATPYEGTFTKADAEKAGLWGKSGPWTQYPTRMLLNRARAFALRDGFADVLKGFKCAEEEMDIVEAEVVTPTPKRKRASAAEILAAPNATAAVDGGHDIAEAVADTVDDGNAAIPMPM